MTSECVALELAVLNGAMINFFYGQYQRSNSYFNNSFLKASGLPSLDEFKWLESNKKAYLLKF